jgi:four helix bundle protein
MAVLPRQDLRKRTKEFAGRVIQLFCRLPKNRVEVQVIGKQLIRSGTSVAANYREASRARSRADFVSKIELCIQEADETQLWLELLRDFCDITDEDVELLWNESNELISMFVTMSKRTKGIS